MTEIHLLFPHQLFLESEQLQHSLPVYLVEEFLFFRQYTFHKQKIAYHRASMKIYADYLRQKGFEVHYISAFEEESDVSNLLLYFQKLHITKIHFTDPSDNWLEKRLLRGAEETGITLKAYHSPQWINTRTDLKTFFRADKQKFFQTTFYQMERKRLGILINEKGEPMGGKWSFDTENRLRYPKGKTPPKIPVLETNAYYQEALEYVEKHFPYNPGRLSKKPIYPLDFQSAENWLNEFLRDRFAEFGVYEDAIVVKEKFLNHSVLTPMLNVGLLTPLQILEKTLEFAAENKVPLNSTEGFVRQIIGWREFIRGVYLSKGTQERTRNFWDFHRKIPVSFYEGSTGIPPIDATIHKILETGYCHHIERLMLLGNFMLLCEFDPDEVYRWFMEMFVDAYDWVMVPNIYGMSQFADGGLMSTKPYISSSNYLMKMSDYPKGEWQEVWDGLYWRFISQQCSFFEHNPRLSMMVRTWDKMEESKKTKHLQVAEKWLADKEVSS